MKKVMRNICLRVCVCAISSNEIVTNCINGEICVNYILKFHY